MSHGARGYILAGGLSRRFGTDKARALLAGRPLIVRTADAMEQAGLQPRVVARSAGQYDDLGLPTVGDIRPGRGPLAGLETALVDAGDGWVLLAPCDMVDLRPHWIESLLAARQDRADAVAFRAHRWQPMPALYHQQLLPRLREHLDAGTLAMYALLEVSRVVQLRFPADWPRVHQANTPGELESAQAGLARTEKPPSDGRQGADQGEPA